VCLVKATVRYPVCNRACCTEILAHRKRRGGGVYDEGDGFGGKNIEYLVFALQF
jgi:hypothetical protein